MTETEVLEIVLRARQAETTCLGFSQHGGGQVYHRRLAHWRNCEY